MIARLSGRVAGIEADTVIVDVSGVGYLVHAAQPTLARLADGMEVTFWIETNVREDAIQLFGFLSREDRRCFQLLTTVQGVGAKVALAILSVLAGDALIRALAAEDQAALCQAPGVGPKLARRIASELKEKVGGLAAFLPGAGQASSNVVEVMGRADASPAAPTSNDLADAVSALENLGYGRTEALSALSRVQGGLAEGAGLSELIRAGLAELAPQDTSTERRA